MGPISLAAPLMQAGLAGYSDRAMRLVARRRGCPYAVTEAILDRTLLSGGKGLTRSIDVDDRDHPVAGQIMGSDADDMAAAATLLVEHGCDAVDLNFACPVKKVKNKARGGWMLADVDRGIAILRAVRERLPEATLTVSLRRGFDDAAESEDRFWRLCDEARAQGLAAIRVHGRTVEQKYAGRSRRPFLGEVKRQYPDWFVWGSGDVFEPEDARDLLVETGVDGVWVARGAIGNPWFFRDAIKLIHHGGTEARREESGSEAGRSSGNGVAVDVSTQSSAQTSASPCLRASVVNPPTIGEQREALLEHFEEAARVHGEELAGRRMRKIGMKYARFHPDAAAVKARFIAVRSLADWAAVVEEHYAVDGPGVRPPRGAVDEVNATCEPAGAA